MGETDPGLGDERGYGPESRFSASAVIPDQNLSRPAAADPIPAFAENPGASAKPLIIPVSQDHGGPEDYLECRHHDRVANHG